jgi:hypothetical protein
MRDASSAVFVALTRVWGLPLGDSGAGDVVAMLRSRAAQG